MFGQGTEVSGFLEPSRCPKKTSNTITSVHFAPVSVHALSIRSELQGVSISISYKVLQNCKRECSELLLGSEGNCRQNGEVFS